MSRNRAPNGLTAGAVWRAVRTPLTLLFLLGVLAFGARWGYDNVTAPLPPPPPTPCVDQPVTDSQLTSQQVTVTVFNGGSKRGLAGDVAFILREAGFTIAASTNTNEEVGQTVVIGAAEDNPEVQLVMSFFKEATFRADGRVKRDVDVLVGDAYAGMNGEAKKSIAVDSPTICLAPLPSPNLGG